MTSEIDCIVFIPGDHRECMWCWDPKSAHELQTCPECEGTGWFMLYEQEVDCPTCEGNKILPLRKGWELCECEGTGLEAKINVETLEMWTRECPECNGLLYVGPGRGRVNVVQRQREWKKMINSWEL